MQRAAAAASAAAPRGSAAATNAPAVAGASAVEGVQEAGASRPRQPADESMGECNPALLRPLPQSGGTAGQPSQQSQQQQQARQSQQQSQRRVQEVEMPAALPSFGSQLAVPPTQAEEPEPEQAAGAAGGPSSEDRGTEDSGSEPSDKENLAPGAAPLEQSRELPDNSSGGGSDAGDPQTDKENAAPAEEEQEQQGGVAPKRRPHERAFDGASLSMPSPSRSRTHAAQ